MHIQQIVISNILGLARADIVCATPVIIVAGNNEAGKSTLSDAISMAIMGSPRRVKLKKELSRLLHDDAAKGRVTVMANGEVLGDFKLPGGAHTCALQPQESAFVDFVLDPGLFARQTETDRRATLFKLTRCKASPDATAAMLVKRGISEQLAGEVKPLLRGGFPAACTEAKDQATQAKGAWRRVTGEAWGSDKAVDWAPQAPAFAVSEKTLTDSRAQLQVLQQDLLDANQAIGATKAALADSHTAQAQINALNELANLAPRRATKLASDEKNLAEWKGKFEVAQGEASGEHAPTAHECPHCQGLLEIKNDQIHAYQAPNKVIDREARIRATEYREYYSSAQRAVNNDKRDLLASQDAAAQAKILTDKLASAPTQLMVDNAQATINELRQQHDTLAAKTAALTEAWSAARSREGLIIDAERYRQAVTEWLQVADALSPNGIPAEILASAIAPVNDALALLAKMAKWKPVQILDDMTINVGGRLYGLMSESAKWRADTLLALAIAQISELRFVVLDRFDVLDLAGRGQLLGLLCELGRIQAMDTMFMCGTMKAIPAKLPPEATGIWIANGIAETDPQ